MSNGAGTVAAALVFYTVVLGGREVWSESHQPGTRTLSFIVNDQLVTTGEQLADAAPIVLRVADPGTIAARCWNEGFEVRVAEDDGDEARLAVVDPFGKRIGLAG